MHPASVEDRHKGSENYTERMSSLAFPMPLLVSCTQHQHKQRINLFAI